MKFTKAQLIEHNATLCAKVRDLEDQVLQLKAACADRDDLRSRIVNTLTHQAPQTQRPIVPVYEWNPAIKGDFQRALHLAKENNGRCQRMRSGSPR